MRRHSRGLTLLEIMVSVAILSMVSVLIYGAFDGLQRSKTGLGRVNDRYHVGRATLRRLAEEISSAFISLHTPYSPNLIVRKTIFAAKDSSPADRIDMTTFSHRRVVSGSRESDQNELSYFGCPDPAVAGKTDLCRREATIIDIDPQKGGVVYVVAEDIDLFDVKFLDPMSGMWTDSWDTTQAIGQANRMPLQVRITLVLRNGPAGKTIKFEEKVPIPIFDPVAFAIPRLPMSTESTRTARRLRAARRQKRGVALIMVLAALSILTVLLAEFQDESSSETAAALADRDALKAEYTARSAVNLARLLIATEPMIRQAIGPLLAMMMGGGAPPQIPVWEFSDQILGAFNDVEGTKSFAALTGISDLTSGGAKNLGIKGARFDVVIVDEDSKINVNLAARGDAFSEQRLGMQLMGLMQGDQFNPIFEAKDSEGQFTDRMTTCGSIVDWADPDENLYPCDPRNAQNSGQAAEDSTYYALLKVPYRRKNAAFDSLQELHLVRGVTDEWWQTFVEPDPSNPKKRTLTVWGQGAINVNSANAQTLYAIVCGFAVQNPPQALCVDPMAASKFLMAVNLLRGFTAGAPLFGTPGAFVNAMKGQGMFGMVMKGMLGLDPIQFFSEGELKKAISTESKIFSIYADGVVPGYRRQTKIRIHAVVDFRNAPPPGMMFAGINPMGSGSAAGMPGMPPGMPGMPGMMPGTTGMPGMPGAGGVTNYGPGGAGAQDAISGALAANPGGSIVYYRIE